LVPLTAWFQAVANAAGEGAREPAGRTASAGSLVVDSVGGSDVVEASMVVDVVGSDGDDSSGRGGGSSLAEASSDDGVSSSDEGVASADDGGSVEDSDGVVALSPASWFTMATTAIPRTCERLGVVVVVDPGVAAAVDEVELDVALAIPTPIPARIPRTTSGISTWDQTGSDRYR
jgi:hypothetical protein